MASTETDLTYAGRRLTAKNVLAYFYSEPGAASLTGFKKPLVPGANIGTIVRITREDDDTFYVSGAQRPRVIGQAPDSPDLLRWSVAQEAAVAEHAQISREKKIIAAGADPIRKQLAPIREQLAAMSPATRTATIGFIISYLTSGR